MRSPPPLLLLVGCLVSACAPTEIPAGSPQRAFTASGARRLSRAEYEATVRDLVGAPPPAQLLAQLPEDATDPFDNDYRTQDASAALVEAVEALSEAAAERVGAALLDPARRPQLLPCAPKAPDDVQCLSAFVERFGRRALRRPLRADEIAGFAALAPLSREAGDFHVGVKLAVRALLQDEEFLYRVEVGVPDPQEPGVARLTGYELASRLSYFLLGTTPDDALLDLAAQGGLGTPSGVRKAAQQLLRSPRARERVQRFHALWLGYHQLPHAAELAADLRAESAALIDRVVFQEQRDYLDLFRLKDTFLTARLAQHYRLAAPPGPQGGWVPYGSSGRQGILSHGAVLSAGAKFSDTSPTQRGLFVRSRFLCEELPKPPPSVDADNPPPGESACKIDRYAQHTRGGCAGCHGRIDPIGMGLEAYDKAGRFRLTEEGKPQCPIPGAGELAGVGPFRGPAELGERLMESRQLGPCVLRQVYRFAMGRREDQDPSGDAAVLADLADRFESGGRRFDQLLVDLVSTESFAFRRQHQDEGGNQ